MGAIELNNLPDDGKTVSDREAIVSARKGAAIYDSSPWGRILVSDADRLRFLHNQSTADFQQLKPGEGCDTVFVTSTARTIDLATGLVLDDEVLLLVSPNRREYLLSWLDRYIFFADKVKLTDITDRTACLTLIGAKSDRVLTQLGFTDAIDLAPAHHCLLTIANNSVRVAAGSGLGLPGYRLICDRQFAPELMQTIIDFGVNKISETAQNYTG
jgi:tRNA-modifying protein YgfZ